MNCIHSLYLLTFSPLFFTISQVLILVFWGWKYKEHNTTHMQKVATVAFKSPSQKDNMDPLIHCYQMYNDNVQNCLKTCSKHPYLQIIHTSWGLLYLTLLIWKLLVTNCPFLCSPSPRLVDMGKVYRQTNLENLEQAFGVAERDLGVTRLLDPEGKTGPFDLIRHLLVTGSYYSFATWNNEMAYFLPYPFRCWCPTPWWEVHHHLRLILVRCHASDWRTWRHQS